MQYKNYKNLLSVILSLCLIIQMSMPLVYAEDNGMQQGSKTIIAFEDLAGSEKNITVAVNATEEEAKAKMPSSLRASYQETTTGSALSITIEDITWELDEANSDSATFDSSQNGASYTYKAKLPATDSTGDKLVIENGVSLPTITVLVGATPMLLGGGVDEASIKEQGGNITTCSTIEEAIAGAQAMENCTVTLLKDATAENGLEINTGTFAIDLNGKTLTCEKINVYSEAKLTMCDSSGNNSGKLLGAIFTKGELNITGGTYQDNNPSGVYNIDGSIVKRAVTIFADNGSSGTISGGIFKNNPNNSANLCQAIGMNTNATLKLIGGYFDSLSGLNSNTSAKLPIGYKLVGGGGSVNYPGGYIGAYGNVTVEKCEAHNFGDNEKNCTYCHTENPDYGAPVWLTINDTTTKYETTLAGVKAAFDSANGNNATISFMETCDLLQLSLSSGTITIDLNGKTLRAVDTMESSLVIDGADVILKNGTIKNIEDQSSIELKSGSLLVESTVTFAGGSTEDWSIDLIGGTLEIDGAKFEDEYSIEQRGGDLTVNDAVFGGLVYIKSGSTILNGGSYASKKYFDGTEYDGLVIENDNKTIADIIPDEAVVKISDGTLLKKSDLLSTKAMSDINILGSPIKIISQPQKPEEATYGYAESRTLSVSAEKTETASPENELSYKWFLTNGTNPTQVGTGTSYVIPIGLDTREYNYYCEISCGNYKMNSQTVKFTVKGIAPRIEIIENFSEGIKHNEIVAFHVKVYDMDDKELTRGKIELKENGTVLTDSFAYYGGDFDEGKYYPLNYYQVSVGRHDKLMIHYIPDKNYEVNYVETELSVPSFTVSKGEQDEFVINQVTGKKFLDGDFTLSTTGGTGTGAVSYSASSNDVLSISGNTATITGAGTVTVTATKTEDENYLSATAQTVITIGKASAPTITFPTAREITYGQKLIDSILDGGSISLGSFSWIQSEQDLVPTVNGATNTSKVIFTPNATTVKNYEEISQVDREADISFTVNKAQPSVNLSTKSTGTSGNRTTEITINLSKSGFGNYPQGTIKLVDCTEATEKDIVGAENVPLSNGEASYTWTGLSDKIYKVKAVYDGDDNYSSVTSGEISFDTTKKEQENFKVEDIGNKTYGDETFMLMTTGGNGTGTVSFESSDSSVLSIQGNLATIHKAGIVNITAKKAGDNIYNPTEATASFNIAKKTITVKADNKRIKKGSALPKLSYTVKDLVNGDSFTVEPTLTSDVKDTNVIGNYVISISGGTLNNSENYTITYVSGELVVENNSSGGSSGGSTSGGGSSSGGSSGGGGGTPPTPATPQAPPAPEVLTKEIEKLSKEQPQSAASPKTGIDSSVFTDIANHWAKDDIAFVTQRGLFGGTAADKFSPNMPMTRGMFVTVLGRLANADLSGLDSSKFADVKTGAYYAPYVEWANKNNIVSGTAADKFSPNTPITREQMAAIIANYSKFAGVNPPKLQSDEKGVATRAQVSAVLRRYIEFLESQKSN